MDLSNNQIGGHYQGRKLISTPEGPRAIAEALRVSPSMTVCDLRKNTLGVEGWTIIFNALRDSTVSKITTWDLSGESLGPGIAEPLAKYLAVTASLTSLR